MKSTSVSFFLFIASLPLLLAQTSPQRFPKLVADDLNEKVITIPDDLRKEINILILVFERDAQPLVNSWVEVIQTEFEPKASFGYHEVPMMSSWYIPMAWQIDNWMREGIAPEFHDNTVTFYGDRDPYYEALNIEDKETCYLFLLDREGTIRFRTEGKRDADKDQAFREAIREMGVETKD